MLIVTRKAGESVFIGDDVKVTVLKIEGRTARLGFDAPRELGVHREEVYMRINDEVVADHLRVVK